MPLAEATQGSLVNCHDDEERHRDDGKGTETVMTKERLVESGVYSSQSFPSV